MTETEKMLLKSLEELQNDYQTQFSELNKQMNSLADLISSPVKNQKSLSEDVRLIPRELEAEIEKKLRICATCSECHFDFEGSTIGIRVCLVTHRDIKSPKKGCISYSPKETRWKD